MIENILGLIIYPSKGRKQSIEDFNKTIPDSNIFINQIHLCNFISFGIKDIFICGDKSLDNKTRYCFLQTTILNMENCGISFKEIIPSEESKEFYYRNWFELLKDSMEAISKEYNPETTNVIVSSEDKIFINEENIYSIKHALNSIEDAAIVSGLTKDDFDDCFYIFNVKWFMENIYNINFSSSNKITEDRIRKSNNILLHKSIYEILDLNDDSNYVEDGCFKLSDYYKSHIIDIIQKYDENNPSKQVNVYYTDELKDIYDNDILELIYTNSIIEIALVKNGLISKEYFESLIELYLKNNEKEFIRQYIRTSSLGRVLYNCASAYELFDLKDFKWLK